MTPSPYQKSKNIQVKTRSRLSLQDLKATLSLEDLALDLGIELRPAGPGRLVGLCPIHSEKTPSFIIFQAKNRFRCFGCGAAGDAIDFIAQTRNQTVSEVIKDLAGGRLRPPKRDPEKERRRAHEQAVHKWESRYLEGLMVFYTVGRDYLRRHARPENWTRYSGLVRAMAEAEVRIEIFSLGTREARDVFRRGLRSGEVVYV